MLLKRLAGSLPPELASTIPELESVGIKTTESIIFTHPQTILSLSSLTASQVEALVYLCIESSATRCAIADELPQQLQGPWQGWGIRGLDELLDAWNGVGIVEIAGPRKVGKSLLALHAALKILVQDKDAKCMWMDTEGTFSPERAEKILTNWGWKTEEERISVLNRVIVTPCFKLEGVYEVLQTIKEPAQGLDVGKTKVLIIDNIYIHFRDLLTNVSAQGHAELVALMEEVEEITYSQSMVSMIINSSVISQPTNSLSHFNSVNIKPALGSSFTYLVDVTLLIQETGKVFGIMDEEERERIRKLPGLRGFVEVIKSRVSPTGLWTVFETDGTLLYHVVPPPMISQQPRGSPQSVIGPLKQTMIP
ncbi:uncharacterized protein L203_100775 [Cryptococcus depauperatus CBS 7841]|uniref:Rad51-like C-terminal domain-containing protein n=1 Tax=Cryptococcus depauperatus CBS 7841 TaxID=1295531 RepID=A0AAJ8JNT2_9TREE